MTTTTVNGRELVRRLGAAMHRARTILTRTRADELKDLDTGCDSSVAEVLTEMAGLTDWPGHIRLGQGLVSTPVLRRQLINILASNIVRNLEYFVGQLQRARGDTRFLLEKQPRQRQIMRETAENLLALEPHREAILESHLRALLAASQRLIHKDRAFSAGLGLDERSLSLWLG